MAFVSRTHLLRLRFRDNDGAESTCEANLSPATSISSALSFLVAWRPLVEALSSATCIEADLLVRLVETSGADADVLSDCQRQAVLIFDAGAPGLAVVRVPSVASSLLESSGPYAGIALDQSAGDVADLLAGLSAGLGGVQPCDPFASDLGAVVAAYMQQT